MKWFVFTLLLVNIVIFVWHFQPESSRKSRLVDDQLTRLVLLKEFEQQLVLSEIVGDSSKCFSIGPFNRWASFNIAQKKMETAGIKTFGRVSSDSVRNGYWVMLQAKGSRNQAMLQIQRLKEKGVQDYFLVAAGEMTNSISLGVFSKPKLAKRRKDNVSKLGFEPIIKKITIPNRVYWLEWPRFGETQPDKSLLGSLMTRFAGIGQTEKACIGVKNGK